MRIVGLKKIPYYEVLSLLSVFTVLFYICYRTPILWDDWGRFNMGGNIRAAWRFSIEYRQVNGRLFGNTFSIYILGNKLLYALISATIFTVLTKLIAQFSILSKTSQGQRSNAPYMFVSMMVLCTPIAIVRESFTWIAGFGNYIMPLFALFIYIYLQRGVFHNEYKKSSVINTIFGLILGLLTQLFIENVSILAVLVALALIVLTMIRFKKLDTMQIAFLLGSIIGLVVMFSAPGYKTLGQTTEWNSLSLIEKITTNTVKLSARYINMFLTPLLLLSLHQIWKLLAAKKYHICVSLIISILLGLCSITLYVNTLNVVSIIPLKIIEYTNIVYIITLSVTIWMTNKNKHHIMTPFLFHASLLALAPLVMASYWGSRNFVYSYFFIIATLATIIHDDFSNRKIITQTVIVVSLSIILVWGSVLVFVYRDVARTEKERINIFKQYNIYKTGEVHIPKANYEIFFHGINPDFRYNEAYHIRAYKRYHNIPQDTIIYYK